jgi:hypothetical protein
MVGPGEVESNLNPPVVMTVGLLATPHVSVPASTLFMVVQEVLRLVA